MRTAYNYSLDLLAARAYTERNLKRKLVQKEFDPSEIESALDRLKANGLLDDSKFAANFARQRLVVAGAAIRRTKQELARKGIDAETATQAVNAILEDEPVDTEASLERIAKKKLNSMGDLDPQIRKRRLFAFLARRGYELDDIKRVVDRLGKES